MTTKEHTVLILDTKNRYDEKKLSDEGVKVSKIEKNHEQGLNLVKKSHPDTLVKVINEGERYTFNDTVSFLKKVKDVSQQTQVLVINVENERKKIYELLNIGVNGVCDGKNPPLIEALKLMEQYNIYISYSYQKALLEEFRQEPPKTKTGKKLLHVNKEKAKEELTNREIEILEDLVENGGNYEERSKRLYISPKTLKNHMIRIMDKLHADNRTHIIPIAIKKGIIEAIDETIAS